MSSRFKAALLALTAPLLTDMALIAFDRATTWPAWTRVLSHDVPHDRERSAVDVAVIELAAQIAAFTTQVVTIAQLMLFGSSVVHRPVLVGWLR